MSQSPSNLLHLIEARKEKGLFRELKSRTNLIDFSSNDYLGFSSQFILRIKENNSKINSGSTGSRLISGNSEYIEKLERKIADFHSGESALLFNSGYDANLGLLSSISTKHDLILYDELIHASLIDGIRLGLSKYYKIKHNDVEHLKRLIERNQDVVGNIYVVVESVYSMDGDFAPLKDFLSLCDNKKIFLIVDEAHALGVFGECGKGVCQELKIERKCFARIYTYGKAMGCHGASIVGDKVLRNFLVNYARSFIYTTALPMHSLMLIESAYELLGTTSNINLLKENIAYFNELIQTKQNYLLSESAIHCKIISGNENINNMETFLEQNGFFVKGIKSPTVKDGLERLRISIHSFNTKEQIKKLVELIN